MTWDASQSAPEEAKPLTVLSWIVYVLTLPWRLIALFVIAIVILPGLFMLMKLPSLAKDHDLDLTLLSLRAIDRDRVTTPLVPLGYHQEVREQMADLVPDFPIPELLAREFTLRLYDIKASGVTSTKTAGGGYEHVAVYSNGSSKTEVTTTPHLKVGRKELAEARKAMNELFPTRAQTAQVLKWGESLFWTEWLRIHSLRDLAAVMVPVPAGGTPEEQLWLAWTVLRGKGPEAEKDLPRLPELFEEAFPDRAGRKAALAWAKELYDRMEAEFKDYQQYVKAQPGYDRTSRAQPQWILADLDRVLPPRSSWTYCWLLYRYVGLSEASRATAREHWLSCFPAERHSAVVAFGEKIAEQRRTTGEPLPPVPELLPLVCAVERLVGSDPNGRHTRTLLDQEFGQKHAARLRDGVLAINPNDDFFYLEASNDPLRLYPNAPSGSTWRGKFMRVSMSLFFIGILLLGINTVLCGVLPRVLISSETRPLWQEHVEGRGKERWWISLISLLVCGAIAAVAAPYTLADSMTVHLASFPELLLGGTVATLIGGFLIASCRRALAVLLVGMGVDITRTWLDEILGIAAGGLILFYFGNELLGIAVFALSDLIPAVLNSLMASRQPAGVDAPPPPPSRAAQPSFAPTGVPKDEELRWFR